MPASTVYILHPEIDRIVRSVAREIADKMVRLGQARYLDGKKMLRLSPHFAMPATGGRTYTSRGGVHAAIGRSQVYTRREQVRGERAGGAVISFKRIDPADYPLFCQAWRGETI